MEYLQDWRVAGGLVAVGLTIAGWLGDRRRRRRKNLDAVGLMPWTELSFWAFLAACVLLGLAARSWWAGEL